jgi:hypothetical protein
LKKAGGVMKTPPALSRATGIERRIVTVRANGRRKKA